MPVAHTFFSCLFVPYIVKTPCCITYYCIFQVRLNWLSEGKPWGLFHHKSVSRPCSSTAGCEWEEWHRKEMCLCREWRACSGSLWEHYTMVLCVFGCVSASFGQRHSMTHCLSSIKQNAGGTEWEQRLRNEAMQANSRVCANSY